MNLELTCYTAIVAIPHCGVMLGTNSVKLSDSQVNTTGELLSRVLGWMPVLFVFFPSFSHIAFCVFRVRKMVLALLL